jgi:hypothetical protein
MTLVQIALVVLVVGYVVVRRFAGSPMRSRSYLLPLGVAAYGGFQLWGHPVSVTGAGFLAVQLLLALGVGALRGTTIQLFVRDGVLWQRYQLTTLAAWVASIALRLGLVELGRLAGVPVATSSLLLVLGVSLLAEAFVVGQRAVRHGAPIAPGRRTVRV